MSATAQQIAPFLDQKAYPVEDTITLDWIDYPLALTGLQLLSELYDAPMSFRSPGVLIWGPTNNGKTSLARKFEREKNQNALHRRDRDEYPVVFVQTPPGPDVKHFCRDILHQLGADDDGGNTVDRLMRRVLTILENVGTRMLIIDEIHNILDGNKTQRNLFLNNLKYLSNQLHIPIVTIGTDHARIAMQTDQQIGNRFTPFHLPEWDISGEYAAFVGRVFNHFGINAKALIAKRKTLNSIHNRTSGLTGETWALARLIAKTGYGLDGKELTMASLDPPGWIPPQNRRR